MFQNRIVTLCLAIFIPSMIMVSKAIAESTGDCIVLEFTADGCSKCSEMHQTTDQAIQDGWVVRRFDTKRDPHVALRWQIQSVPTTVLVRNGREVDRVLGPIGYRELKQRMLAASSVDSVRSSSERPRSRFNDPAPLVRGQSTLAMIPMATAVSSNSTNNAFSSKSSLDPTSKGKDSSGACVRIRVAEPHQESVGTGTIIDSYNGEALVLTCGHLFRESQGQATITVETFLDGQIQTYPATLIDFQAKDMDIGLISFRPNTQVPVATLIPKNRTLVEGQSVFSLGCDRGAIPSRIDSKITKLNRYLGASNVEVDGQPVEGRSGGGLFDERGELIGVCYAADPELKEGLYNGAEVVYHQLSKLGLQRLFNERSDDMSRPRRSANETGSNRTTAAASELTVIVKDSNGTREQLNIQHPSPQLLQALRESSQKR